MATANHYISGLKCNTCANKVLVALQSYAKAVDVSLSSQQIKLTDPTVDVETLNAVLKSVGNYQIGEQIIDIASDNSEPNKSWVEKLASSLITYKPLLLIFGYILLVCVCVELRNESFELHRFMPNFMAGFFLIFSFFKLLDLTGFASGYAMYDLLAKRVYNYGFIYPFIELGLGMAYLVNYKPLIINSITLIVMTFSGIGVMLAVRSKQKIRCACLGTGFNLPMTTVTIIEDLLMAMMAAWMLI